GGGGSGGGPGGRGRRRRRPAAGSGVSVDLGSLGVGIPAGAVSALACNHRDVANERRATSSVIPSSYTRGGDDGEGRVEGQDEAGEEGSVRRRRGQHPGGPGPTRD